MGPGDGYICQFSRDTNRFWAARNELALGATFMPHASSATNIPAGLIPEVGSKENWSSYLCHIGMMQNCLAEWLCI
jgi:hypothetical protein